MPTAKITRDDKGKPVIWQKEGTDDQGRGQYRKINPDGSKGAAARLPEEESKIEKE